jgi:hypothetical protein
MRLRGGSWMIHNGHGCTNARTGANDKIVWRWATAVTRSFVGAPPGTRTPNPRIKSPLFCQLS